MKKAIVIGTFDTFHNGHYDLLMYGLKLFDKLIIEIGNNPKKDNWFSPEERKEMILKTMKDYKDKIEVNCNSDLTCLGEICHKHNAYFILRGRNILTPDNIKEHEQVVIDSRNPEYNFKFAKHIENADIDSHAKIILESNDDEYIKKYSKHIKNINPNNLEQAKKLILSLKKN